MVMPKIILKPNVDIVSYIFYHVCMYVLVCKQTILIITRLL